MSENKIINLTINGKKVIAKPGQTILEVAGILGIEIPTLCYYPFLEAYGGCRICVVEAKSGTWSKVVTACNYEVWEGLEVETDSQRVLKSRRISIELLLARCPDVHILKELAVKYGVTSQRFKKENDDCILCGLCVRICKDRMGVGAADMMGRGADIKMSTPYERKSEVCIVCGACESVCPTGSIRLDKVYSEPKIALKSEFELGLKGRSTIHIPFPQALPNVPVLKKDNCIHFLSGNCETCRDACPAGAIDYDQQDEIVKIDTGAIILAPGFCQYDASHKPEMGFTHYPNVVSSLQFERILSASGPFTGKLLRPSDMKKPARIAFIQCVGSRDKEHDYCSSVCCMYALKEAIIAKEHEADVSCEIFFIDIRAHGKDFDAYYERAKELGIGFTRCKPCSVEEVKKNNDLIIGYVDETGNYKEKDYNLVILSAGLEPPLEAMKLAEKFGIELNQHGFSKTRAFDSVSSTRDGIYVCGPFTEPKDIPETVVEASCASSAVMVDLADSRGTEITRVELPPERQLAGEPPRIGVFVCHCGKNIGGIVNVPSVAKFARSLPYVAYSTDNLYTCSSDTQEAIKEKIKEYNLNRVVVASCSPRTHEPLFQQTIREAGLNPYLFEMANIRDQCSWVHMHEKAAATEKSMDLIRLAVAKSALLEPLTSISLPVISKALVVGGGIAGLSAALTIADQGYEVFLVEKSSQLGGNALKLDTDHQGNDIAAYLKNLIRRAQENTLINIYTDSTLTKVEGFVGNFKTTIQGKDQEVIVEHAVAILATGGSEFKSEEYSYGKHSSIKTQLELDESFLDGSFKIPDTVVMIQCVGSREKDHQYCSRVCCASAIKNSIHIKTLNPAAQIYVLYRDIRSYGFREQEYGKAREMGITFIRYDLDEKPRVELNGNQVDVTVTDPVLQQRLRISPDLLVLNSRIDSNPDNEDLAKMFKVPLNQNKFFLEAHVKLRPVEFATDGVFVCGLAHYPKDVEEAVSQARAAAGRAATILSKDSIQAEGKIAYVNNRRCVGCAACVTVCAYNAITLDEEKGVAVINEALCKGCGTCAATCRGSAINLKGFKDEQILEMLNTL
ncbi:MAG: FAD-dependent oxidoreductase [Spirochaetales bacterium]|nr:FAD-dependent oxidoreductase [Spirochaetales bacterium]